MARKRIALWGATGSIGLQTLDVMSQHEDLFELKVITAHSGAESLYDIARKWRPALAVLTGDVDRTHWRSRFHDIGVNLLFGRQGLLDAAAYDAADLVVNALVGAVGLEATVTALEANRPIALANKEVLVMAGELIMGMAAKRNLSILPIDSEHSALFQCLVGERAESVEKLILTASGGPFRETAKEDLAGVTVEQALAHPNWSMGRKVTIDSATLLNKGLEVIEARWLFGVGPDQIEVVVHPQSIVHSMILFIDGSVKAQLGEPDMRIPIAYALGFPHRLGGSFRRMDWSDTFALNFEPPDLHKFPALALAFDALKTGGTAPAVLNAADEIAVEAFIRGQIKFTDISRYIEMALHEFAKSGAVDLPAILEIDRDVRVWLNRHLEMGR
ncbi:1-deoxy-D-xylulose-5-phosphate reductoisomerase [bacterium]|nr:1-deoxy-D-xylulose-5-phosphate reductoisomerase [bacterium]